MKDDIYNMKLHDTIGLDKFNDVLRVAGGWIYKEWSDDTDNPSVTATFVPYNEEFKPCKYYRL